MSLMTYAQAKARGLLDSEEYRSACEVRYVLGLPLDERRDYLERVDRARGQAAGNVLREKVRAEWMARRDELAGQP